VKKTKLIDKKIMCFLSSTSFQEHSD